MFIVSNLCANPILGPGEPLIGEIYFDENDNWFIEFNTSAYEWEAYSFDEIILETSSGQSEVKSGIVFTDSTVLITQDSLLTPLFINPAGDYIKIVKESGDDGYWFPSERCFIFGDYEYSHVGVLYSGQSYCIPYGMDFLYCITKCNVPTPGYSDVNDNFYGDLVLNISDGNSNPMPDIKCFLTSYSYNCETHCLYDVYEYDYSIQLYRTIDSQSDSDGRIDFLSSNIYAMNYSLIFKSADENYLYDTTINISVEPGIENVFDITLDCEIIWVDVETEKLDRELLEVFPNPAKEQVSIAFPDKNIPIKKFAVVKVFSENGDLIKIVPVSNTTDGIQDLTIDIGDMSSGNYYCNLEVDGRKLAVSKFIVVK